MMRFELEFEIKVKTLALILPKVKSDVPCLNE